jgi:hypothetical protein
MQMEFEGRVESTEGVTIFQSVTGNFSMRKAGSPIPWDGSFQIQSGEKETMFEGKLITASGRESTMSAHRYMPGSKLIYFKGTGQTPEEVAAVEA